MPRSNAKVTFRTELGKLSADYGWHFIKVSREVADGFGFKGNSRRVMCTINGSVKFPAGLMRYHGDFFISVNKQNRDRLGIEAGDLIDVELEKDESKYGMPMPDELAEVLAQDPDGDKLFHALTPGKQRGMLYYIGKFKDIDRRIHTSLIFIEHLKKNDGKLVQEQLHEDLKRPFKI